MERTYTSKWGKIVKRCPGVPEYYYRGRLIAYGCAVSSPDPRVKPTKSDWEFCVSMKGRGGRNKYER